MLKVADCSLSMAATLRWAMTANQSSGQTRKCRAFALSIEAATLPQFEVKEDHLPVMLGDAQAPRQSTGMVVVRASKKHFFKLKLQRLATAIYEAFQELGWEPVMSVVLRSMLCIVTVVPVHEWNPQARHPVVIDTHSVDDRHIDREVHLSSAMWSSELDVLSLPANLTLWNGLGAMSDATSQLISNLINGRFDSFERGQAGSMKALNDRIGRLEDDVKKLPTIEAVSNLFETKRIESWRFRVMLWVTLTMGLLGGLSALALVAVELFKH